MSEHVAEFDGKDRMGIADAGQAVLDGPIYAAVVRNVFTEKQRRAVMKTQGTQRENTQKVVRGFLENWSFLHPRVKSFMAAHPLAELVTLPETIKNFDGFGFADRGTLDLHYDCGLAEGPAQSEFAPVRVIGGPLTASIRVDDTEAKRLFRVYRGQQQTIRWINDVLQVAHEPFNDQAAVDIEQRPGDMVLFGNEPWATQHGVTEVGQTGAAQTRSVVIGYHIYVHSS